MSTDIRKAVELADGWSMYEGQYASLSNPMAETVDGYRFYLTDQILLDYLAAQLVRQVDALPVHRTIDFNIRFVAVHIEGGIWKSAKGSDRTMNTIKAIVDSGVLE